MGYSEQTDWFPQQDTSLKYTVQNGDTFESIASQYGTNWLTDETGRLVDDIYPGMQIYIDRPIQYRIVDGQVVSDAGVYDAIAAQDTKRKQEAAQYGWTIDNKDQEEWTPKEPQPKWYESEYWGDISAGLEAAANADEEIKQHYYNGPAMSTAGAVGNMSPDELAYADQWLYDYTPYGNYVQFWSPSRWLYSLKSAFTDDEFMAPWNKRNPGVSDNQHVNTGIDLLTAFLPFVSKKVRFGKANPTKVAQTEPRVRVIPESSEVANERRSVVSTLRYKDVEDSFIKEGLTPHPELFEGRGLYLPDESVIYDYARKSKDYPLTAMFLNDISTEQGM